MKTKELDFIRIFCLILVILSRATICFAQNDTLYYFDFPDSFSTHWKSIDLDGNNKHWMHTQEGIEAVFNPAFASELNSTSMENGWMIFPAAFYNTDSLDVNSTIDSVVQLNSVLVSNALDFSLNSSIHLSFQQYYRTLSSPTWGSLELEVSTDSINWEVYDVHTGSDAPLNLENGIEQISLDLSNSLAFEPQVWLRFHFRNLAWHFWCIDDLLIGSSPIENSFFESSSLPKDQILYPNPIVNQINIPQACQNTSYIIFDAYGKEIKSGWAHETIDFTGLRSGVYFIWFASCQTSKKVILG